MKKLILKTKRGGASMFIVMFTVIVLSIITLSFTRLIIAEANKTTNTDLSQSAYDSALAGVEDAKIALLKYHACLDNGNTATREVTTGCRDIIKNMQEGIAKKDCSTVSKVLGRKEETEKDVVIQETSDSTKAGNNASMLQSYTCVTISEELEDYRTTLSSQSRLRIIPIRSTEVDQLGYIRLRWFSDTNYKQLSKNSSNNITRFCANDSNGLKPVLYPAGNCSGGYQTPTTIMARLIQTDDEFNLSELSVSSSGTSTDTGTLMFVPTTGGSTTPDYISSDKWGESANKADNLPIKIRCASSGSWLCSADIQLPNTFRNRTNRSDSNTYLLIALPYGSPETDLSVKTYVRGSNAGQSDITDTNRRDFTGVQARIDSTGRANDLYRRVETRVELVDTFFAYPEFEITLVDSGSDELNKTFYATFDCWDADNGTKHECDNSYEDMGFTSLSGS